MMYAHTQTHTHRQTHTQTDRHALQATCTRVSTVTYLLTSNTSAQHKDIRAHIKLTRKKTVKLTHKTQRLI